MAFIVDTSYLAYYEFGKGVINPNSIVTTNIGSALPGLPYFFVNNKGAFSPTSVVASLLSITPTFTLFTAPIGGVDFFTGSAIVPKVTFYSMVRAQPLVGSEPAPLQWGKSGAIGFGF